MRVETTAIRSKLGRIDDKNPYNFKIAVRLNLVFLRLIYDYFFSAIRSIA